MRSAASASSPFTAWVYRSSVMVTVLCPSRSEATFGCTSDASIRVAAAWRRSWTRIVGGSPARLSAAWNERITFRGRNGVPLELANTRP